MSERTESGKALTEILVHFGVKGMKWGVRRSPERVTLSRKRLSKGIKTKGGAGRRPSEDAKRAAVIGQIGKKSGYQALTNAQLRAYTERKALEAKARQLDQAPTEKAVKFVEKVLRDEGVKKLFSTGAKAAAAA